MNWRAFGPRRRTAGEATDAGVTPRERSGSHRPAMGGSAPSPNQDHRALLRGEIDADEYVRRVMADVDSRYAPRAKPAAQTNSQGRKEDERKT